MFFPPKGGRSPWNDEYHPSPSDSTSPGPRVSAKQNPKCISQTNGRSTRNLSTATTSHPNQPLPLQTLTQPIAIPNDNHSNASPVAENTAVIAAPASSPASVSPSPTTVHSHLLGPGRRPLLPPDFSRHARRCCICSHPDRDAIEGDFIRWHSVELIAREYKIASRKSIYRHAHCTGLFAWRRRELGRVLEGILENAEHVPLVSSGVIVRAARIYAHLDENGNWFEPAHTNFILTAPASSLSPLGSDLLANSARAKPRPARPRKIRAKSNRNNRSFRKKLKSLNKKEKANS